MPTYYVSAATGNDANDGLSEGAPFETLQHTQTLAAAGDVFNVKGDGDYAPMQILVGGNTATTIKYIGYSSVPGDGGKATIDATGQTNGIFGSLGGVYYVFENIIVQNATDRGWAGTHDSMRLIRCEANNNGTNGFYMDRHFTYESCIADGNVTAGFVCTFGTVCVGCIARNNGTWAFDAAGPTTLLSCEAYSNGAGQGSFRVTGNNFGPGVAHGCTGDNDGSGESGIHMNAATHNTVAINNVIVGHAVGIRWGLQANPHHLLTGANCFFDNTNDYSPSTTTPSPYLTQDDVLADPLFTNRAGRDYTLQDGSPALNAGRDFAWASLTASPGMDMGAYQKQDSGNGGPPSGGSRNVIL